MLIEKSCYKDIFCKIATAIGFLLFSIVWISVFWNSTMKNPFIIIGILTSAFLGILIYFFTCYKKITFRDLFLHLVLVAVLLQCVIGYFMMVEYKTWDVYSIHKNAIALISGGNLNKDYFATYPNNIALLLMMAGIYRLTSFFFHSTSIYFAVLLNIIAVDLAVFFSIKIAKELWGETAGYAFGNVCLVFAPLYCKR